MIPRRLAVSAVALLTIAGCATVPPWEAGLTLTVESYDSDSGAYVLVLRNNTSRPAVFLTNYLNFRAYPERDTPIRVLRMIEDEAIVHDAMLEGGATVTFAGDCTDEQTCAGSSAYATAHVCWFTAEVACGSYRTIWSDKPLGRRP